MLPYKFVPVRSVATDSQVASAWARAAAMAMSAAATMLAGFMMRASSVPSIDGVGNQTVQRLIAGLSATAQRQSDYNDFVQKWASKTGGDVTGADAYLNKVAPPQMYANRAVLSTLPPAFVDRLRQTVKDNPQAAKFFDQRFGVGTSALALGQGPQ